MIAALHTGMVTNVSVGGEVSQSFSVTNGVKQGCVLVPSLFSIFFLLAMLDESFRDMGDGVYIQSIQSGDIQVENQDYTDTDERAAIRR